MTTLTLRRPARRPEPQPIPLDLGPCLSAFTPRMTFLVGKGHFLTAGTTGGGKSSVFRCICCAGAPDARFQFVAIDLKRIELDFLRPRLAAFTDTRDGALNLLTTMHRLMVARQNIGQFLGWRAWHPDARHPYVFILIDELAELVASLGNTADARALAATLLGLLDSIGRLGRASGVFLVAATQRAEALIIGGPLRSLFVYRFAMPSEDPTSYRLCLGIGDDYDLTHLTAGLSVAKPGKGIWKAPGGELVQARIAWRTDNEVDAILDRHHHLALPLETLVGWALDDEALLCAA